MLPAVILAGGLATRLRPLTETIPKSLVEVAGQPFVCHQLEYLRTEGVRRVVICVGHLGELIEEVVGDGSGFGIDVVYSPDGSKLLGTGGAIKKALPHIGPEFFVLYGDSFLPIDFSPVERSFRERGKPALMTVLENSGRWDSSNVLFRDGQLIEYNKAAPRPEMSWIDYGLAILSASLFKQYSEGQAFDLAELYHRLSLNQQLSGYVVQERFYEIGTYMGLKETNDYFLKRGKQ